MPNRYPDELREKVVEAYGDLSRSVEAIAQEFGVNKATASKWASAAGLPKRAGRRGSESTPETRARRRPAPDPVKDLSSKTLKVGVEGDWVYDSKGIGRWVAYDGGTP